ncbi:MAG: branched-chain amino acid ABC transporter permease [Synergistaceae bacterium]|jgi:branched-chain amino acid transport system permease protein|nr:branched-chain amino acid ABC transporter permease [Synergistaceae bacterium]
MNGLFANTIIQVIFAGLTIGAVYSLVAVGFSIVYMGTRAINFMQGEYVMIGGVVAGSAYEVWNLPVPACLALAAGAGVLAGVISEAITVRWMRRPSPSGITVATVGLAVVLKAIVMIATDRKTFAFPPFTGDTPIKIGGAALLPQTLWNLGIVVAAAVLLTLFFRYTRAGVTIRASADDAETAKAMGVSLITTVRQSFILAAVLGTIAGASLTPITLISFNSGTLLGLKGFSAAVLGGLGNMYGALASGLIIGLVESIGAGFISSLYSNVIAFAVLLFVLFVKPAGILAKQQGWDHEKK